MLPIAEKPLELQPHLAMPSIITAISVNRYTSTGRFGLLPMTATGRVPAYDWTAPAAAPLSSPNIERSRSTDLSRPDLSRSLERLNETHGRFPHQSEAVIREKQAIIRNALPSAPWQSEKMCPLIQHPVGSRSPVRP